MRMVIEIADTDAHVPVYVVRHSNRDRQTKDGMRHSEGVDVAIAAKDLASHTTSDEADDQQHRIGNVREAKESGAQQHRATSRN